MIRNVKNYIENNSSILFKTSDEKNVKAVFDNRGFWFHEVTQPYYDIIKSQPHIYVAFNKHGYYVGISDQSGGRWKRQHAYHLGTLAHHLMGTLKSNDQNHLHWIEAWMKIGSLKLDPIQNTILLKEEVYISFIPFKLYSGFNNHHIGNSLPPKNIIRKINNEFETALIQSLKDDGKTMLNVKKSKKAPVLQKKSNEKKLPPPKKPNVVPSADLVGDNNCVEFKVSRHDNISSIAQTFTNLPKGPCTIELFSVDSNDIRTYVNGRVRIVRALGRTVSEYFNSPDTKNGNTPKWKIVKDEMNKKNKIIDSITVRVCPINQNKTK
jgi:hypothetical protein